MEIWHRIALNSKKDAYLLRIVDQLGIKYSSMELPGGASKLVFFDIKEADASWEAIADPVRECIVSDIPQTFFSKQELLDAELIRIVPAFEHGYPQPQNNWLAHHPNYAHYCAECGSYSQTGCFRIRKEPSLGNNDFMTLTWTYTLFCSPAVQRELEDHGIQGYEVWNAVINKTGSPSKYISQLYIPAIASPGLSKIEDLKRVTCSTCGITKYHPHRRGVMYLKREALAPNVDFMQTYEWFGSGHAAYREMLVSNRVAKLIIDQGWRGIHLKVIKLE